MATVVKVRRGRGKSGGQYLQLSATEVVFASRLGWALISRNGSHLHGPLSPKGVQRCLGALDREQSQFRVTRSRVSCDPVRRWTVTGPATDGAEAVLEVVCTEAGVWGDDLFMLGFKKAKAIAALATERIHASHRETQVCGYSVRVPV